MVLSVFHRKQRNGLRNGTWKQTGADSIQDRSRRIPYMVRSQNLRTAHNPRGYLVCLAFIIAGAAGNIFDCVFYGLIFDNPAPPQVASLFPAGGGYAPIFLGRVVDMLYFPLSVSSGLHGYHLSADSNSFSFSRFSTLPMQPFRVE